MAIQVQGNAGTVAEVSGTGHRALRVEQRPLEYGTLGYYRINQNSGVIVAATGAGELYQFRWTDATRLAAINKVTFSAGANAAATAAGLQAFELVVARSFTVAGTGGTAATITGNNMKLRTNMGTTLLGESRIASTTTLGAGTKTLDTQGISGVFIGIGTGAITTSEALDLVDPPYPLLSSDGDGQHPLILATNEGFVIRMINTMPLSMTWGFTVSVAWAELAAY